MRKWVFEDASNYEYIDLGYFKPGVSFSVTKYDDGREYVQSHHPYDFAEYHWALSRDGKLFTVYIGSPGKKVETFMADENREYNDIVEELLYLDRGVKSSIDHT